MHLTKFKIDYRKYAFLAIIFLLKLIYKKYILKGFYLKFKFKNCWLGSLRFNFWRASHFFRLNPFIKLL